MGGCRPGAGDRDRRGVPGRRPRGGRDRRKPARGDAHIGRGKPRLARRASALPSITRRISSLPALRSRSPFTPAFSISGSRAKRRSPVSARRSSALRSTISRPSIVLPLAIGAAVAAGALFAFIPGYLQARRGSHVVITTIMFNFLAAILLVYLLVNVIGNPKSMAPETRGLRAECASRLHSRSCFARSASTCRRRR